MVKALFSPLSIWRGLTCGRASDMEQSSSQESQDELLNLMTVLYVAIQETLNDPEDMSSTYQKLRTYRACLQWWTALETDWCPY